MTALMLFFFSNWYPVFIQLQGEDTGDFEATTAAAFLLSSESSKTIFIAVRDDDIPEADETFVFNLRLQVMLKPGNWYSPGVKDLCI